MRMRSIGTNRAASVSVRQNPGISNWTSSRRGARRALNTDDDETMIIIGGLQTKNTNEHRGQGTRMMGGHGRGEEQEC